MPLSMYKKVGLGELKPLNQLSKLLMNPQKTNGIVEDVLVSVVKFVFPTDFTVLDMEVRHSIPFIQGSPFSATSRALIDVALGELILRFDSEFITIDIYNMLKHPRKSFPHYGVGP